MIHLRLPIQAIHFFYITPFLCIIWTSTDLKDGHATPKFWVLVNLSKNSFIIRRIHNSLMGRLPILYLHSTPFDCCLIKERSFVRTLFKPHVIVCLNVSVDFGRHSYPHVCNSNKKPAPLSFSLYLPPPHILTYSLTVITCY